MSGNIRQKENKVYMMLKFEDIKIDKEFQELLPVLTIDEYEKLEQDILKYGMLDPIKVWKDPKSKEWVIIDGHNRYSILQKHIDKIDKLYNPWHHFKIMYESELKNREEVKQWMLEQQLGRRNLSEVDRYEIVQKFKETIENRAKENLSAGGKGLTNLPKVNTRKEMAQKVGVSEGSYRKLDKVMKSDNEEVKEKLRKKEVSIDKAYHEIENPKAQQHKETTPKQQIEKFDNRMNEIDKEISSLRIEREALMRRRSSLFEALDIECELKYEFVEGGIGVFELSRKCRFYIEFDGHKKIFVECGVFTDVEPDNLYLNKIPEKYKNDFIMLWKKAHEEDVKDFNERTAKWSKQFEKENKNVSANDDNKDFYKKCFRILAKSFHPDNSDGSIEDMQNLNQLKMLWGI